MNEKILKGLKVNKSITNENPNIIYKYKTIKVFKINN